MAFTPTKYLREDSNIILRDQRHAARLFADDQFRLAPKFDFQFHVSFSINEGALRTIDLVQRHRNEINMLVKSIGLPKFNITAETVNQYNRKKNIQLTHKYDDISIVFHDDNMGLINQLWQNYYTYYYADPTSATKAGAYNRTATRNSNFINNPYGLDNGSTLPFFNYIKVYQMARHEWVCYTLYNPIIKSWDHAGVDYTKKETHQFTMSVGYEAVSYSVGNVELGQPEGFGLEHYDQTPSPLTGLFNLTSASPSFVNNSNMTGNATEFLNNLTTSINSYQNTQQLNNGGTSGLLTNTVNQGVGGIQNVSFPTAVNATNNTIAAAKVILG